MRFLSKILKRHIKALVSRDKSRPAMTGAFVDTLRESLVVTNGHALIQYPIVLNEGDEGVILPIEAFPDRKRDSVSYKLGDDIEITLAGEVRRVARIPGNYPNWKAVIPDDPTLFSVNLDFDVVLAFIKAIPGSKRVRIEYVGPRRALRVIPEDDSCGFTMGLIMPLTPDGAHLNKQKSAFRECARDLLRTLDKDKLNEEELKAYDNTVLLFGTKYSRGC